jgi:hypothetical protein
MQTQTTTQARQTDQARRSEPQSRRGSARPIIAGVVAVLAMLIMMTAPASAAVNYYGAVGSATVSSSTVSHLMRVTPSTTPMAGHEQGQWVIYHVAARDVTYSTPGAWKVYAWQGPFWVTKSSSVSCVQTPEDLGSGCTNIVTDTSLTTLGGFTISGYALHRYEVQVEFGYAVGNSYYPSGWFKANDCFNTYVLQGVTFNRQGANCAT